MIVDELCQSSGREVGVCDLILRRYESATNGFKTISVFGTGVVNVGIGGCGTVADHAFATSIAPNEYMTVTDDAAMAGTVSVCLDSTAVAEITFIDSDCIFSAVDSPCNIGVCQTSSKATSALRSLASTATTTSMMTAVSILRLSANLPRQVLLTRLIMISCTCTLVWMVPSLSRGFSGQHQVQ